MTGQQANITAQPTTGITVPFNTKLASWTNPRHFLDKANSFTGQLSLSVPLITFKINDGLGTSRQIQLVYDRTISDIPQTDLGLGWKILKNCILYDPKTSCYSITLNGTFFPLHQQSHDATSGNNVFAVPGSQVVVILHQDKKRFEIFNGNKSSQTYESFEFDQNCWLLSKEAFSDQSTLTYCYQIENQKAYITGVTHSKDPLIIPLQPNSKAITAISLSYRIDALFKLSTVTIQQNNPSKATAYFELASDQHTINVFDNKQCRFLSFGYEEHLPLLSRIALPTLGIHYRYEEHTINSFVHREVYVAQGTKPRLFYGSSYAVGAYINGTGQLCLELCDSSLQVKISSKIGYRYRFPGLALSNDEIDFYTIIPQDRIFAIYLLGKHSGKIVLFNKEPSEDVFQKPLAIWDSSTLSPLEIPGIFQSLGKHFYFKNGRGLLVFYQNSSSQWVVNSLLLAPSCLVFEGKNPSSGWIYAEKIQGSSSPLLFVKDLSHPLQPQQGAIPCKEGDCLSRLKQFVEKLTSKGSVQKEILQLLNSKVLEKNFNYMLLSSLTIPQNSSSRFKTDIECFYAEEDDIFNSVGSVSVHSESLSDISKRFFPQSSSNGQGTYCLQIYYSNSSEMFKTRLRNVTILPDDDNNRDDYDWQTGVSYSIERAFQLSSSVSMIQSPANKTYVTSYTIKKNGAEYTLDYNNPGLKADLIKGQYTFQFTDSSGSLVAIQPTAIRTHHSPLAPIEMVFQVEIDFNLTSNGKTTSQTVFSSKPNGIYQFITSLYQGSETLTEAQFSQLVESDQPLSDDLALSFAESCLSYFPSVDVGGKVRCYQSEMIIQPSSVAKLTPVAAKESYPIGGEYFLKQDKDVFVLCNTSKTLFTFPKQISSFEQIVNFYPSCLIFPKDGVNHLLLFEDVTQSHPFTSGQLAKEDCYPFSPFFTLAIKESASSEDQTISVYTVPELANSAVSPSANAIAYPTLSSQSVTYADGSRKQSTFTYEKPWQFSKNQIFFRSYSVTPIAFSSSEGTPQGKTTTLITNNQIETTVFDISGRVVQKSKNQMAVASNNPISERPVALTSTLKSQIDDLPIAIISGAFFEDQEADLMSFESYEVGRIGKEQKGSPLWEMSKGTIKQGWGFSGQHYVQIGSDGNITATYRPNEWKKIFVAGAWIRSPSDLSHSSPLTFTFKNDATSITAQGQTKLRSGDWIYQEAILSLADLPQDIISRPPQITISISSGTDVLDVDTVMFFPMGCSLKARVFDPITRLPTHIFDNKGMCQQLVYSDEQVVGAIRFDGKIEGIFNLWNPSKKPRIKASLVPTGIGSEVVLQVEDGFLEDANPLHVTSRWKMNSSKWITAPFSFSHVAKTFDALQLIKNDYLTEQMGCHFECEGYDANSVVILNFGAFSLSLSPQSCCSDQLPLTFLAVRIKNRLLVFANQQLLIDRLEISTRDYIGFGIEVYGLATLKNIMVFSSPKLSVNYKGTTGQVLQTLILIDESSVQIRSNQYDSLGRKTQSSFPSTILANEAGHLLTYRSSIGNVPSKSLVYTHSPASEISQVKFSETEYASQPSSIFRGSYRELSTQTTSSSLQTFMNRMNVWMPSGFKADAYTLTIIQDANGMYTASVQNEKNQLVASYQPKRFGFIQNQFTYDQTGRLLSHSLPRQYSFDPSQPVITEFKRTITYTEGGQLCTTFDPDYGRDLMIHDPVSGALRFQVHYKIEGTFGYLLAFDYDPRGCVNWIGYHPEPKIYLHAMTESLVDLHDEKSIESALKSISSIGQVPDAAHYLLADMQTLQTSYVSHFNSSLEKRGRLQLISVNQFFGGEGKVLNPIGDTEEFYTYDLSGKIVKKERWIGTCFDSISYGYNRQKQLSSITYPTPLSGNSSSLRYDHDPLGRISKIQTEDGTVLAHYSYIGASNLIEKENLPSAHLIRKYSYNSLNQLIGIEDGILNEKITHTTKAFQKNQNFTQTVSSTTFSSPWAEAHSRPNLCNGLLAKLAPGIKQSMGYTEKHLLSDLQEQGYLDRHGFVTKRLDYYFVYNLPIKYFDLQSLIFLLDQHPSVQGISSQYAYEFGNQLTKAKCIQDDENSHNYPAIFSISSILEFLQLDQSAEETGRIIYEHCIGEKGQPSLVNENGIWNFSLIGGLEKVLNTDSSVGADYLSAHPISLRNMLVDYYILNITTFNQLSRDQFAGCYDLWMGRNVSSFSPSLRKEADAAYHWLQSEGFIDNEQNVTQKIFPPAIIELISKLDPKIVPPQNLIKLFRFYLSQAICQNANDIWMFGEDDNGNMSKYFVGPKNHQLTVSKKSNRIISITNSPFLSDSQILHSLQYDGNGNVSRATHRGIDSIVYNPFTNRPSLIRMSGGNLIQFAYDSKGMRSYKKVTDKAGNVISEVRYLRNEAGQVLSEWRTDETGRTSQLSFIRGPSGCIGFVKNGQLYFVCKDHEGSIRTILDSKGHVVFATHYLPYGQTTQTCGDNSLLSYGYIGQEIDEETGLYNFNARLYDPSIGRFYQVDPERQFASPYIYAGNSPISFQDPSGLWLGDLFGDIFSSIGNDIGTGIMDAADAIGSHASEIGGGLLSALEIGGGIAVDVLSAGALAEGVGGALTGAGISGLTYTIQNGSSFSWSDFGEQEGIGAAVGVATAGLGSAEGAVIERVTANIAEDSIAKTATTVALRLAGGAFNGVVAGFGQTVLENAANGRHWDDGVSDALWAGALTGALGAGMGVAGEALASKTGFIGTQAAASFAKGIKSFVVGAGSGFAGDAIGNVTINAIEGEPLDSGLWQSAICDVVGGVTASGHALNPHRPLLAARALRFEQIDAKTNCLSTATFKGIEKLQILSDRIHSPEDLRGLAYEEMSKASKQSIPNIRASGRQDFVQRFKDTMANAIDTDDTHGLTDTMKEFARKAKVDAVERGVPIDEILNEKEEEGTVHELIKDYLEHVKSGQVWGNFLELHYVGHALSIKFRVNIRGEKWSSIGPENADHSIYLQYTGDHYNLFYKQGIAFFTPKRAYVSASDEHGFGDGGKAQSKLSELFDPKSPQRMKLIKALESGLSPANKGLAKKLADAVDKQDWETFSRIAMCDTKFYLKARQKILHYLANQFGPYNQTGAWSLIGSIESNHVPPGDLVSKKFGYDKRCITTVTMYYTDHRLYPTTGSVPLKTTFINAVDEAISEAIKGNIKNKFNKKFPQPNGSITTPTEYRTYLAGLFDQKNPQESYARMLEIEIRVHNNLKDENIANIPFTINKQKLQLSFKFGDYSDGLSQMVDYAYQNYPYDVNNAPFQDTFITQQQAIYLKGIIK